MSTAAEEHTVWIGFMDIVPVIGTVKEAVELVLALYEGNRAVIKEKEKATEYIVKESLKKHVKAKHVKKLTLSDKPAAAAAEFSGLRNVTEVRKEMIIEYMVKGSKRGTKTPTPAQQKERQKRVEDIKKDMLEKIRILNPNFNHELKEELGRPKRGEHVFNNGILRFHFNVLTDFIQSHRISNLRGYNQQAMDTLGRHTLPQNTETDIQTNMVVHFGEDEFYVNANGVMYGEYCRALRGALIDVLRRINPGDVTEEERQRVNDVIDNMNNLEIYVDQLAKVRWIDRRSRQARFEQVRQEVATMYNTARGFDWCICILHEVAPLFEHGQ
ncbi:uncharacterized protein LOC107757863 isoform X2 [Sinocyclocheilus rhinocerous]|uniref:uncharacterized protein LOC107757863 isoform X2 n=1 Tax=Sinocyclocheilus rhinocerous TaxID=307959 RepID=UPI0007BA9153|nr:PREDICTED: uncharacterized protein LOC107757863 isoform X2 [Sinocyclocheilus rhinocerous]